MKEEADKLGSEYFRSRRRSVSYVLSIPSEGGDLQVRFRAFPVKEEAGKLGSEVDLRVIGHPATRHSALQRKLKN